MTEPAHTKQPNRLIHEKSPYLLQHAYDLVNWFPWGNEAFAAAKQENKLIFLSIGYATCHWCRKMAHESFESEEVARRLNDGFINIQVDREELPEIDALYMEFAQAIMAHPAGWPLNVIVTPDLKPLLAVTYLPPVSQGGLMSIVEFIDRILAIWTSTGKEELLEHADKVIELFRAAIKTRGDKMPTQDLLETAGESLYEMIDPVYGGFKGEPKFLVSYPLNVLLTNAKRKSESRALFCVERSLDAMQRSGVYDHLGGGFHRYAVDERWTIPHFEKMLNDNALMATTYLEAWKYTKKESYKQTCFETLEYILREMVHPEGGFFSAQDADIEGKEGAYYTWTEREIHEVLSADMAELFCQYYNISRSGNFDGRNVLFPITSLENFVGDRGIDVGAIKDRIDHARNLLLQERQKRPTPFKDDQILTSWNGLMIDAMARAGACFDHAPFAQAALQASEFLKTHVWREGKLFHRWREGEARFEAGLEDHAFLIKGLLTLFEESGNAEILSWAIELTRIVEERFKSEGGAFYQSLEETLLPLRNCDFIDGAEPSGNGVHAENLVRLYQLTLQKEYLVQAEAIFKAVRHFIEIYPPGTCYHLLALQRYYDIHARMIVVALDESSSNRENIHTLLSKQFLPHAVSIWKREKDDNLLRLLPWLIDKKTIDGQTAVYICKQESCEEPLFIKEDIEYALQHLV
jgi:uncharacterized protein